MKTLFISLLIVVVSIGGCRNNNVTSEDIETPSGMVLIPGGTSIIGSNEVFDPEGPEHEVTINAFFMDIHPVTVEQFREFISATKYTTEAERFGNAGVFDIDTGRWSLVDGATWQYPQGPGKNKAEDNHPVTQVSWNDAKAYCEWAGKRLPTEEEWEYAARNAGATQDYIYPWNSDLDHEGSTYLANVWQGAFPAYNSGEDGYLLTSPVGAFGSTPLGLQDMAGNVWEWCENWKIPYNQNPSDFNPGPESEKVQRGGSYLCDLKVCHGYRVSGRSGSTPETSLMHVGFRCVKDN